MKKRALVLFLLSAHLTLATASAQNTCAARRGSNIFRHQGQATVKVPVKGLPNAVNVGLEGAISQWSEACPDGKSIPDFELDKQQVPPTGENYDENVTLEIDFDNGREPEWRDGTWVAAEYQIDRNRSAIILPGKCPQPRDGKKFSFCKGKRIAWESVFGQSVIAHEIGHALGLDHDTCSSNSLMQSETPAGGAILPEHCQLADDLNCDPEQGPCPTASDEVEFTFNASGLSSGDAPGTVPDSVIVTRTVTDSEGRPAGQNDFRILRNGTTPGGTLIQGWSYEITSVFTSNTNKSCTASPSSGTADSDDITVDITCTCTGGQLVAGEALGSDCPIELESGFEPFVPIIPFFNDPGIEFGDPWYIDAFGPPTGETPCKRETICTEVGPEEITTEDGKTIVTFRLECVDMCVDNQDITSLHGPTMTLGLPAGPEARDGILHFDGWAVDGDGISGLAVYVDRSPVLPVRLDSQLRRPDACEDLLEVGDVHAGDCDPASGFQGFLDVSELPPGEHTLTVIALDGRENFPAGNRVEVGFTVPSCLDTTPPTVTLTAPVEGAVVGDAVTFTADAADNGALVRVDFVVDGELLASDAEAPWEIVVENLPEGPHRARARAVDGCENRAHSEPVSFTVDNTDEPPPGDGGGDSGDGGDGGGGTSPEPSCVADGTTLCLQDNRFAARVELLDGAGQAIPFSNVGGFFWRFEPENVEVAVNVLDGREINGHFWVFHGSLSSIAYRLTVTDTVTGQVRVFDKAADSFCGTGDVLAFDAEAPSALTDGCTESATAVCLLDRRFRVEVRKDGIARGATPVTGKTGAFWFGDPSTPDVVVKALDGRPVNGRFWIFFGSLTNQDYEVIATDTATGDENVYPSPAPHCGLGDTEAF